MPIQLLSTVQPERVNWFWPARIPFGMLTLVDGDPGLGKTTFMLDLIARASRGRALPFAGQHEPLNALILTVENTAEHVLVPRLVNAEADLERIGVLKHIRDEEGNEVLPAIPDDVDTIERELLDHEARILLIDPIVSYLPETINMNNTQQVYRALNPLAALAERTGAAVVLLRHLNKAAGGPALYRGQGGIGFLAAARASMVVGRDQEHPEQVVIANNKTNLSPPVPALAFALVDCANEAPRVAWGGTTHHTADALLSLPAAGAERTAVDEAAEFLRDLLTDGPLQSREVWKEANAAGMTRGTLLRAKGVLRITARKAKGVLDGGWVWHTPEQAEEESHEGGIPYSSDSSNASYSSNSSLYIEKNLKNLKNTKNTKNGVYPPEQILPRRTPQVAPFTGEHPCAVCGEDRHFVRGVVAICANCASARPHASPARAD